MERLSDEDISAYIADYGCCYHDKDTYLMALEIQERRRADTKQVTDEQCLRLLTVIGKLTPYNWETEGMKHIRQWLTRLQQDER